MNSKKLHMVTFILVIVGGVNWGLVGLLNFDLVAWLFYDILGSEMLARLVYILVGVAAVYEFATHKKTCVQCGAGGGAHKEASEQAAPSMGGGM